MSLLEQEPLLLFLESLNITAFRIANSKPSFFIITVYPSTKSHASSTSGLSFDKSSDPYFLNTWISRRKLLISSKIFISLIKLLKQFWWSLPSFSISRPNKYFLKNKSSKVSWLIHGTRTNRIFHIARNFVSSHVNRILIIKYFIVLQHYHWTSKFPLIQEP